MKGSELWNRAKRIIPGGNQLLSKRPERFLPGLWPSYYSKAKGCEVWDMEGNHYYDFARMGVGACVLGYADDDVDQAVIKAIQRGSMCTLNCIEEIELAEKLVALHHWAEMARFARSGGEACAIAIRIARAATGKSKVAFCGYHGWHDWYLAANIADPSNLDQQLLTGLKPAGVPKELMNTALPFNYNSLSELETLTIQYPNQIGVIIMECQRDHAPVPGFLEGVRQIASKIGAVLIFDEVTSGFRMNLGGVHLNYPVKPDMAVFAKALGNGYPIAAVIGKRDVMNAAQDTFISSTMWTEAIGFTAALATISKMEKENVPAYLIRYGEMLAEGWTALARKYGLSIKISGIPPLTHITFLDDYPAVIQTFYAQEMLKKGFLVESSVYTTFAYTQEIIEKFISASDPVFALIKKHLEDTGTLKPYLQTEILDTGFKRLT